MKTLRPNFIVGIGGSAGGLNAYKALMDTLPSHTGMAFVFVTHMLPDADSYLAEILSKRTKMPVMVASTAMPIRANHVYVSPPNADLLIENYTFKVVSPRTKRNAQVDLFLTSLARAMGTHAIGIILSGYSDDGTEGCKQIKAKGGITFAQDTSAEVSNMPLRAQAAGCIDFVLPPGKISEELVRIAHTSPVNDQPTLSEEMRRRNLDLNELNDRLKLALDALKDNDMHKDEFLAMLAHELRNPLTPIRNALEIWRSGDAGEKAEKELQMIMDRQLQKMVRLVDDLLDVSRITRGTIALKKDPVDLVQLISQTVESLRHQCEERQHKISLLLPKEKVLVKGDAIRLEQVVSNILINACKYTEPGGHITVTLEREIDSALIRITDNGVGISPELLPHIFDLFVQAERSLDRAQGGLGIGLTLVRRLVELQGGNVEAKSQGLNKGSEFIVRLPIISEVEVALPVTQPVEPQKASLMKRILVIEDNADASMTTKMLLELQGHTVQTAVDGLSGIKAAQTFKPEVILLDIGLPGMDGYEVARRLRKLPETEKALLIALSGYGQAEDRRKSKEAGCDHHLVKPADAAKLRALISG